MRFGWLGFHTEGLEAIEALTRAGHRVEAVITLDPQEAQKRSGVGDYSGFCRRHNIDQYQIRSINDVESLELLQRLNLDVLFVIGWSQIVGVEALNAVRVGMIGAHASKLPHNRGSAPVNWAIIRGETSGGNSLIWLAEGVDEGDVIDTREFPITVFDTCKSLYEMVATSTAEMLCDLVPRLESGERPGSAQPVSTEPILPRRRPKDGAIDWELDGMAIYNFIRALTDPYPGAFSWLDGERYLIWRAAFVEIDGGLRKPLGTVLGPAISPSIASCGQAVSVGDGMLVILEIEGADGVRCSGQELASLSWEGKLWTSQNE